MDTFEHIDLLLEYARLLRIAWLNPSHKPAQTDVHAFEHEHDKLFSPLWIKWQEQYYRGT